MADETGRLPERPYIRTPVNRDALMTSGAKYGKGASRLKTG